MYKNPYRITLTFSEKEGEQIKRQAALEGLTPYALLKMIVCEALNIRRENKDE